MYTEITFSMDARSSAPHRVGSILVPQARQYFTRWVDRGDRSYVTLMVRSSIADAMVAKVCRMHPTVRCISRDEVLPATASVAATAS
jgi:hypothetical protein